MRFGLQKHWPVLLIAIALTLASCTGTDAPVTDNPDGAVVESPTPGESLPAEPMIAADLPRLEGQATVELVVNGSPITIEVNGEDAPITAGNFVDLVERGVYDGTRFHRVVKAPQPFVVQGGDPQSADSSVPVSQLGTGGFVDPETGQQRMIPLEILPEGANQPTYSKTFEQAGISEPPSLTHQRGAVAMARSEFPDSASSQFYITLADVPFLDGSYAVFGMVTDGMDVVDAIEPGDVLESATVVEGLDNLQRPTAGAESGAASE